MEESHKQIAIVVGVILLIVVIVYLYKKSMKNSVSSFQTKRTKARNVVAPKMELANPNYMQIDRMYASKEGFIVPPPPRDQTKAFLTSSTGGTSTTTSNPFIGGLPGESIYGVSVPGMMTNMLMNNANDPGARSTFATVI